MLEAYQQAIDETGTIEQARDAFLGKADTEADFAAQWLEDTGGLEGVPEHLRNYFARLMLDCRRSWRKLPDVLRTQVMIYRNRNDVDLSDNALN